MNLRSYVFLVAPAALLLNLALGCDTESARSDNVEKNEPPANPTPAADNTAVNERDRDAHAKTPFDQEESQVDIDISASIRRDVLAEEGFSVNAKNAKIITADGRVTLRGVTESAAEKARIGEIAGKTPGVKRVDNELEVVPHP
jgi:hyperosmotically inducible protein